MVAVVAMVAAMVAVVHVVDGQAKIHIQRRCYVCRSRGELGDCRDQFIPPEPLPPGTPVQVPGHLFFVGEVFLGVGQCSGQCSVRGQLVSIQEEQPPTRKSKLQGCDLILIENLPGP